MTEDLSIKKIKHESVEYPLDYLIGKIEQEEVILCNGKMRWNEVYQSKFIEALLLGIPLMRMHPLLAIDVGEERDAQYPGCILLVNGHDRLLTLIKFLKNELKLINLKELPCLESNSFEDFSIGAKRRLKRESIKLLYFKDCKDEKYINHLSELFDFF